MFRTRCGFGQHFFVLLSFGYIESTVQKFIIHFIQLGLTHKAFKNSFIVNCKNKNEKNMKKTKLTFITLLAIALKETKYTNFCQHPTKQKRVFVNKKHLLCLV